MLDRIQLDSLEILEELKKSYLDQTVAPLDGMWLCGFVPQASHYGFYSKGNLVGYYCLNDEAFVLQFYLAPEYQDQSRELFDSLFAGGDLQAGNANGSFVSTAEPQFLSYCLDHFNSFEVNALMYQLANSNDVPSNTALTILGEALKPKQLDEAVSFAHLAIGAPREWLQGYFVNLIEREELFGKWTEGRLIATGECRAYDAYQTQYADIGMIVGEQERCKGVATRVLQDLVLIAKRRGLHAICSTEKDNIAAQKAITRSGFLAKHRILKFTNNVG